MEWRRSETNPSPVRARSYRYTGRVADPSDTPSGDDDPFENLTLDENFIRGASVHELDAATRAHQHRPRRKRANQASGRQSKRAQPGRSSVQRPRGRSAAGGGIVAKLKRQFHVDLDSMQPFALAGVAVVVMTIIAALMAP